MSEFNQMKKYRFAPDTRSDNSVSAIIASMFPKDSHSQGTIGTMTIETFIGNMRDCHISLQVTHVSSSEPAGPRGTPSDVAIATRSLPDASPDDAPISEAKRIS